MVDNARWRSKREAAMMGRANCFRIALLIAVLWTSLGCDRSTTKGVPTPVSSPSANRLQFEDSTESTRIQFTYQSGVVPSYAPILQVLGGGCGILDLDRDGWLDAFFPGGGWITDAGPQPQHHGLFQNLGSGVFRDVSAVSGVQRSQYYSHGVAAADYDSDGFPDLLVTGYGGLQLFRNQGDGTFDEFTEAAGLTDRLWSTSAAWGDVNGDGHLDVYTVHYVDWTYQKNDPICVGASPVQPDSCPPTRFNGLPDTLYLSLGTGHFRDISKEAGLRDDGKGLGVNLADLDGDGDVDIYVANDTVGNFLYRNEGNNPLGVPHFSEIGAESGAALSDSGTPDGSMGVAILDLNRDSRPDLWVSNYEFETPGLYRNEGGLTFNHVSRSAGVAIPSGSFVSFGTVAADFDGDSDSDVLVTNGHVLRYPKNGSVLQRCQLFEQLENGRFQDVAVSSGECLRRLRHGRGLAAGDLDGDGAPDVILTSLDEPVCVLSNRQKSISRWLKVELAGVTSPRDGTGATIRVTRGGIRSSIWIYGGESYLSTSSRSCCIPDEQPGCSRLEITWPSGRIQTLDRPIGAGVDGWQIDSGSMFETSNGLVIIEPEH